jgi:sigma-B regulation protein RsbU (phosphoserine phosphatase)
VDDKLLNSGYLSSIIDAMNDMVRVITKEGRVALTNKAFDKKFAGSRATVGQRCYKVLHQDDECERCLAQEVFLYDVPQQLVRRYNKRVYSVTVSPLKDDEGKTVAAVEVFRDMTLDYNIKQNLLLQNAKMQKDLKLAHNLQQSLVKNILPEIDGYKLSAGFFPCEAVSGDIYDCILHNDKLLIYVADVSGHGVMPAMLSVFFSRTVRAACSLGLFRPAEILRYVQSEFMALDLSDSVYITGFLTIVDIKTGELTYANAGLPVEPILYDGKVNRLFMGAPPISRWFEQPDFKGESIRLKPGHRLLLYSDGIKGIQSEDEISDRFCDLFCETPFSGEQFIYNVRQELYTKPEDDLTLLICEKC